MHIARSVVAFIILIVASTWVHAQPVPVGPEFPVNAYTTSAQRFPVVASTGSGSFVVVWQSLGSSGTDTANYSIQGQRYDSSGAPQGAQFQVNTYTTSWQLNPAVAADAAGNFVVVWDSFGGSGTDTDGYSIHGRRYDSSGTPQGSEFQVNTYTSDYQRVPAVAVDTAGNFLVAWQSTGSGATDTDSESIQGQRYSNTGAPQGVQFQVNSYTTFEQRHPAVAADGAGNFVVVWQGYGSFDTDTYGYSIQGQRYDSGGGPQGPEFQVNTYTTDDQADPSVTADQSGNFVVVWAADRGDGTDTDEESIQGRRYDVNGTPQGSQFQVNSYTTDAQFSPAVATDQSGNFVVVWASAGSGGSDTVPGSIHRRHFDASGTPQGGEFQVNTYTTSSQQYPAVASDAAGNLIVVWHSFGSVGPDSDNSSIDGQRFAVPTTTTTSSTSTTSTTIADLILGKKMVVKDPTGLEQDRRVIILAREAPSDVELLFGLNIPGDATLRVIVNGATPSDQTYLLDASGWTAPSTTSQKYLGPTGVDGDPVKKVILKRSAAKSLVKVLLRGNVGTQPLDVVPPDSGMEGGIILTIPGLVDQIYCATFGGAAGGSLTIDTPTTWTITNPTLQPGCPAPSP